jgi:hypothetical protein
MQLHGMLRSALQRRRLNSVVFLLMMICAGTHSIAAQSDPSQIMQQLTDLQQQMAGATDPCPFMPKLKSLINQIAEQDPDVYKALKPSLDMLNNQDDGCKATAADASPEPKATSTANPDPGERPTGISTGTASPPSCIYLSPSQPCVPLAQYQQMQVQTKSSGKGICPASGFVPGVMLRQTSDVAVGVPCKPGTPYGPLIATTASGGYTGLTPPDPTSAGSGASSSSDGTDIGGPFDTDLNACIDLSYKHDPVTGTHLIIQNNCSVRASINFYASSQVLGAVDLNPGEADNTYAGQDKIAAAGGISIYACPVGDVPRKADGTQASNGVNNQFRCSRK